ncbi:MAG: VOC family protein [Ignavibacteriales bacterium]|nr:VOC family protein [Ignavibacteriales bacterium]MCB9258349.1 VOC family protein [Ignavibacteriales bacterium]
MNPVVHFEMAAEDSKRMSEFYTNVFGWRTVQYGPEMGNYIVAQTTETGENGMIKTPGTINGGFYQKLEDPTMNQPSIVISVDDIKESMEKIKNAGGKLLGEPMPIPGVGEFVSFIDTEGNRCSILQPISM